MFVPLLTIFLYPSRLEKLQIVLNVCCELESRLLRLWFGADERKPTISQTAQSLSTIRTMMLIVGNLNSVLL